MELLRGFDMARETIYRKPSLFIPGKVGRAILEEIKNAPKPDEKEMQKECDEIKARILEAKENETF